METICSCFKPVFNNLLNYRKIPTENALAIELLENLPILGEKKEFTEKTIKRVEDLMRGGKKFHKEYRVNSDLTVVKINGKLRIEKNKRKNYGIIGHPIRSGSNKTAKYAVKMNKSLEIDPKVLFARITGPINDSIIDRDHHSYLMRIIKKEVKIQKLFQEDKEFVKIFYSYVYFSKKRKYKKRVIMMELCDGEDLKQFMIDNPSENRSKRDIKHLKNIFYNIFLAHVKMQDKKVVHGDIKPENIFLKKDESGLLHSKIGDFGFAQYEGPSDRIVGSPLYFSKDYYLEPFARPKNDLWAVGMIIYEMLYDQLLYCDLDPRVDSLDFNVKEDLQEFYLFLHSLDQDKINEKCNQKEFSDPFEKGMQEILRSILVLDSKERPDAKTIFQLYCQKFDLPYSNSHQL